MPNLIWMILLLSVCLAVMIAYCIWKTSSTSKQSKGSPHKATVSEEQATQTGATIAENDLRILRESLSIITTTKNVGTALRRIPVMESAAKRLQQYQNQGTITVSSDVLKLANMTTQDRGEIVQQILSRTYQLEEEAASTLKTERGRKNRLLNYFRRLYEMKDLLPESSFRWADDKLASLGFKFEDMTIANDENHTY